MQWTPLHAHIHQTIRTRDLFTKNHRLLIAVSGGQDSLCLSKLLLDLQPKWGWHLGIAHCDHRWRSDSQANAQHVENLARHWNVSFHLAIAEQSVETEAAARDWRYHQLTAIAREHKYDCVVTGHTASDRAETLLYNLIRGTGADGMQALTWQRPLTEHIWLVRPLLETTRSTTGQFCQDLQLSIWEDITNQDVKYTRNRIRQELLPYLQTNFNPNVESALARTAELLQAEVEYLQQVSEKLYQEVVTESPSQIPGRIQIHRRQLQTAPIALQRRVMRQVLQKILPCAPNFEHIEKLTALIIAPNKSQTDPFPGGAIAQTKGDLICFSKKNGTHRFL
ncbi:MAG: tRNA lysidine(34) synthetase TilS [Calothrix sp. MO_192.B10]|nr:tRNA lysidine(34) synthetase TilS [Calothrix sp. MO_192.B10]